MNGVLWLLVGLALLVSCGLAAWVFRTLRSAQHTGQVDALQRQISNLQRDLHALSAQVHELSAKSAQTPSRSSKTVVSAPVPAADSPYNHAIDLVRLGLSASEVASRCGISHSEAELIASLYRNSPAE
ncbi:DUF2802 domain-containing protein [Crenobacter sp. SG2305]|uniref:DUF2802 domain-containing protein n=1 Tax=Crenobacter oryzisoli TaxID=3056844 RepID=UPI0025AB2A33|nr:DUF2802 domain-containing protein [Crenobacter sp. SG2305]MDN0082643.1 DUF2802 domain-containing protein [Crenobacter sp. SG2305]